MEKKIKFEDIVAFIRKAMSLNCTIDLYCYKELDMYSTLYIYTKISKDERKGKEINWAQKNDKLYINLSHGYSEKLSDYIIEVENRKDILKWETLIEEVIEYTHQKLETEFENFFKEEYPTLKDINDLDDKED